ncbi:MAG: metallophosphoesterase family protein [Stenotrophobium sp.]
MRIAVIGDPHFAINANTSAKYSHNTLNTSGAPDNDGPWHSLLTHVDKEKLRADYLICAGDLGTNADPITIKRGWEQLQELGKRLSTPIVACATGNHDILSRGNREKLAENVIKELGVATGMVETLKMLDPVYPIAGAPTAAEGRKLKTQYFGDNIAVYTDSQIRIVVFNSCCEHNNDATQYERGSAPESALKALREAIDDGHNSTRVNLLVCHHPPMALGSSYEFIQGGATLIEVLEESAQWLLVHGHIHRGRMRYGEGGSASTPILFSAASLGAKTTSNIPGSRNQFYILDVSASTGELKGTVEAWDWRPADGWEPARRSFGGIHHRSGFGSRPVVEVLADDITRTFQEYVTWDIVEQKYPQMKYFIPETFNLLQKRLTALGRFIDTDDDGNWIALAKLGPQS